MSQEQGNIAEVEFIARSMKKGLKVSRPVFVEKYDCLVDNGKQVLRVQIKTTNHKSSTSYQISLLKGSSKKDKYQPGDCDIFAIYLWKENIWYIIPFGASATHLYLHPDKDSCRYDKYKEAWNILHAKDELSTNELRRCGPLPELQH